MATYEPGDVEQQLLQDRWLRRLAAQLVWEGIDADDVAQDTWLAALRRPPRVDDHDGTSVRGWFNRVLRNAARDRHRSASRRRVHEGAAAVEASAATQSGDPDGCPSEAVVALERRRVLLAEVEALAEPLRSAIVARYLECASEAEAAQRLGVPLETLRTRLKRGRELLRSALERRLGGAPALFGFLTAFSGGDAPNVAASNAPRELAETSKSTEPSTLDLGAPVPSSSAAKLALATVAALAAVVVGVTLPWSDDSHEDQALSADSASLDPVVVSAPQGPARAQPSGRREAERAPVDGAPTVADVEHELAIVLGRVVDEHGGPLAGATLQLTAYKALAADRGLVELDARLQLVGVTASTDDHGAFRIIAPLCGIPDVKLRVQAGLYRDFRLVHFGTQYQLGPPILTAGEFDLGDLQLGVTGAVRGRVVDVDGRPLSDVEVDLGPERGTCYRPESEVWTDAHGTFEIPFAPIGVHVLHFSCPGYLQTHLERLRVVANTATSCAEVALDRAGTLSGIVLASDGSPIADAYVTAWPHDNFRPGSARTAEDGRFRVDLWAPGPHQIEVQKRGFVPRLHDPLGRDAEYFEAGASAIELVLAIAADSATRPRTASSLAPNGVVRGRVLDGDNPVIGAHVRVAALSSTTVRARNPTAMDGLDLASLAAQTIRVETAEPEHAAFAMTDTGGRFEATGAHLHPIHVTVFRLGEAPHVFKPGRFQGRAERDLGDIQVVEGGTIEGEVLVPTGVDPIGLCIDVEEAQAYADARGRFRIVNIPAGDRVVALEGRTGALEDGVRMRATVEPGATTEVVIDARHHGVCEVAVRVLLNDAPAEGCWVTLDDGLALGRMPSLGQCDAAGAAHGFARALRPATLRLHMPDLGSLDVRDEVFELTPGALIERTISIVCGDLELVLPPGHGLPSEGLVRLELSVQGDAPRVRELACKGGLPTGIARAELVEGRLRVPTFVSGRYHLEVFFAENAAGYTKIPLPGGGWSGRRTPSFEWRGDIEIRAGEATVVDLARQ
jgi:RNA polymerase sigma factor (sigma-70 family)